MLHRLSELLKFAESKKTDFDEIKNKLISDGMFSLKLDGGVLTVIYLSDSSVIYDDHRSAVYFEEYSSIYATRSQFRYLGYEITNINTAINSFVKRSLSNPRAAASSRHIKQL